MIFKTNPYNTLHPIPSLTPKSSQAKPQEVVVQTPPKQSHGSQQLYIPPEHAIPYVAYVQRKHVDAVCAHRDEVGQFESAVHDIGSVVLGVGAGVTVGEDGPGAKVDCMQ